MDESQKAYPRHLIKHGNSLGIIIPPQIIHKLELKNGQDVLIGASEGLIIIKITEFKLAKKDLKVDSDIEPDIHPKLRDMKEQESKNSDINPLDRLELK